MSAIVSSSIDPNTVAAGIRGGRKRRRVLLCTAVFVGGAVALAAAVDVRSAYAGEPSVVIETILDSTWPKTGDC